jgi:predicted nucleic acid-binding protein
LTVLILDTDICVDLLRQFPPSVAWLSAHAGEEVFLPGFVVMELFQGCANKRELSVVQAFVKPFPLLWPSADVADQALDVFANGHLTHNLGLLDALIGQIAVALNTPLHTFNQKHFAAVPGLGTVQPYKR